MLELRITRQHRSVRSTESGSFLMRSWGTPPSPHPHPFPPHLFISLPWRSSDIHKHSESNTRLGRYGCRTALPDVRRYRRVKDSCSIIDRRIARGAEDFSIFTVLVQVHFKITYFHIALSWWVTCLRCAKCVCVFFFSFCKGSAWIWTAPGTEDVITFFSTSVQLCDVMRLLLWVTLPRMYWIWSTTSHYSFFFF